METSLIKLGKLSRAHSLIVIAGSFWMILFLAACGGKIPTSTSVASVVPTENLPNATPTSVPPSTLSVCLGQEPASLFPINNPSSAARSVLSAVYDGPIDTNTYGYQPVILQALPSLANGDAQLFKQSVFVGDEVVDANGTPVTLVAGTRVRPSGCSSASCEIVYDGKDQIQMDEMQVTFRLLPGLTWSDGEPLQAQDSVYSYSLASTLSAPGTTNYLADRTKSYEAADELTVQWWGKPGFIDPTYFTNFWMPLPQHQWSQVTAENLQVAAETTREPLGWGPYFIQEWVENDHITLKKNPHYFRASEGLPKFDTLTFRFVADAGSAVSDLVSGACDVLDPSIDLDSEVGLLRTMAGKGQLKALFAAAPVMEQLAFGIHPAIYDNGYHQDLDRPDYFSDVRVRQAVTMCIDRQKVIDTVLFGLSSVPSSFVPAAYPLFDPSVKTYPYDVAAANSLLDQAGWRSSGDLSLPRRSLHVQNVADGLPLQISYVTTAASQRIQVAGMIADSLAQCGIKVNIQYLDQSALYDLGPQGVLFGRKFDLAEFAMASLSLEPPCEWFTSSEIPNASNHWVGTNVSGFSSTTFDVACQASEQSLVDSPEHAAAYQQAQSIFAEQLPVLPLYWRIKTAAAQPGLCNFTLDPTASSALWNIESFDIGSTCQP
jgi:peptide/nickel transport system substrate-binding protein